MLLLRRQISSQCETISDAKHQELTTCCFADDLIEAYIDSGQLELARKTVKDAAVVVSRSTYSGSVLLLGFIDAEGRTGQGFWG